MNTSAPLRWLAFFIACSLFPGIDASDASSIIEFATPSHSQGNVTLDGLQWALLVFSDAAQATWAVDILGGSITNHTRAFRTIDSDPLVYDADSSNLPPATTQMDGPLQATLGF